MCSQDHTLGSTAYPCQKIPPVSRHWSGQYNRRGCEPDGRAGHLPPVSIVPGSIDGISANCTSNAMLLPMKITSPGCALTPSKIPIARAESEFTCPADSSDAAVDWKHGTSNRSAGGDSGIEAGHWQQTFGNRREGRGRVEDLVINEMLHGLLFPGNIREWPSLDSRTRSE